MSSSLPSDGVGSFYGVKRATTLHPAGQQTGQQGTSLEKEPINPKNLDCVRPPEWSEFARHLPERRGGGVGLLFYYGGLEWAGKTVHFSHTQVGGCEFSPAGRHLLRFRY